MEREPIMSKISACSSSLDQMKQGPSTECWNHSILCESDSRVQGVNIKGQIFLGSKVNHFKMFVFEDQLSVKVYQANILHASVDCIVNAANKNLQHGGGVAKVISKAAGNELDKDGREYVNKYGYIGVGKVCCTTAGLLNYKCVIHAVGPNWREYRPYSKDDVKRCEVDLYNAIFNSLKEANRRHLESIAFPGISAVMLVCWTNDVRRFALQFHDHVLLDTSTSGPVASVRTCALPNDTVHFSRRLHGTNNYKLQLNLSTASSKTFRAYFDTKRGQSQHHIIRTYSLDTDSKRRFSRSVNDGLGLTDIAECGVTRSCVRYGEEGCTQFTCDYFLSTNVSGRLVDVEMSAKTSGWVALGVSSDDKMGGDEVTACFKSDPTSLNVEAAVFENPYMHDHPKRIETDAIKLKQSTIQDGYIYCRLSRPESYQSLQDLSAKWFQLYATGHVSQSGSLEKHRVTPKVSSKMVSFLNHYNILNGAFIVKPYGYLYVYFITFLTTCILYH